MTAPSTTWILKARDTTTVGSDFPFESLSDEELAEIVRGAPRFFVDIPAERRSLPVKQALVCASNHGLRTLLNEVTHELCLLAIEHFGADAFMQVPTRLRTEKLLLEAIKIEPECFSYTSQEEKTRQVCELVMTLKPSLIWDVPQQYVTPAYLEQGIKASPRYFEAAPAHAWTADLAERIFADHHDAIYAIPNALISESMWVEALSRDHNAFSGRELNLAHLLAVRKIIEDSNIHGKGADEIRRHYADLRTFDIEQIVRHASKTMGGSPTTKTKACLLVILDADVPEKFAKHADGNSELTLTFRQLHGTRQALKNLERAPKRSWIADDLGM